MDVNGPGMINRPVQIKIYYGNIDESGVRKPQTDAELTLTGEFKLIVIDEKGQRTSLPIVLKENGWEAAFTPHENGTYRILGINNTHPVVYRSKTGGKNILPVDYLCAAYTVGGINVLTKPAQFLDILTYQKDKLVVVKAFNNGIPAVQSTRLRVFNPDNWEKELSTDEKGEAVFIPTMKGLYIIREDWVDPKSGSYKGVSYSGIRHRCNYFLLVR